MARPTARFIVLALVLIGTSVTSAQNRRVLTAADYDRAVRMLAQNLNGLVVGGTVQPNWLPDGRFWYVRTTLTGTENVGEVGPGWEYYLDMLVASRDGQQAPDFGDYYPAMKEHFEAQR